MENNISSSDSNMQILEKSLSNAIENVIGTMAGVTLSSSEKNPPDNALLNTQIIGVMMLVGDMNAMLCLTMSNDTASLLVSYMTGIQADQLKNDDVYDGVSELINMISGSAKSLLKDTKYSFRLTAPFTVVGENRFIIHKGKGNKFSKKFIFGEIELNLIFIIL